MAVLLVGSFGEWILRNLRHNATIYFFVLLLFLGGVAAGALAVSAVGSSQKEQLDAHLRSFFFDLHSSPGAYTSRDILRYSLTSNIRTALVLWATGFTVVGIPFVMLIVFGRGFVLGFSAGFLVYQLGYKGLALGLASMLPQNVLAVPAWLVTAAAALAYSINVVTARLGPDRRRWRKQAAGYTALCLSMGLLLVGASLIESYITPVFMKTLMPYVVGLKRP